MGRVRLGIRLGVGSCRVHEFDGACRVLFSEGSGSLSESCELRQPLGFW